MKQHLQSFLIAALILMGCNHEKQSSNQHFEKPSITQYAAPETETYTRSEIIYGRTYGTALTMDVFSPKKKNRGLGIVLFISEGWYSEREKTEYNIPIYINRFIENGYTIFAVVHGSNPKFSLQENYEHAKRAVRFIRHHAKEFGVDGNRLGATGDSAGGHLALLVGSEKETGRVPTEDPVEQESCKVQAVVAFFPPTDFFNWGKPGNKMLGQHPKVALKGAFTFYKTDSITNELIQVKDTTEIYSIVKSLSPLYCANEHTAPTMLVYGDKDSFIPIQQSEMLAAKLKELKVPVQTVIEKGGEHDETTIKHHLGEALEWFNRYLKN